MAGAPPSHMVAIDLVGGGVKVTARRVVFVVGDDARPRLPPSIDPSRLLRRLKAGQLDESPVHISADVLEVQQSRDGHDAAYVCRGGVVLTRGQQLRATAPTLTVDARTHEASSGPCKLQWAPARSLPQGWAAAMVARGLTRSRAAAASCRIDLRTGDWTCHDVDARLQRSWSKGAAAAPAAALVHADRLALSFAGAAGLRVSGDGSEWLPGPSHGNPPLGASRLQVLTRGKEALDSLRQARRTALETTLSRRAAPSATPAPPLPPPAPSLSAPSSLASPPRRVRSLCARLSPSARSVALRLPIPMPELRAASGVAPRVRLSASARVRLPVATRSTTSASHATVRARWDARRGASSSLTVRSLRDTTTATTTAPRATSRAETPSDALATTVMARELVLGRYASSRAASLGPLPSSISVPATPIPTSMPASPRSTGPRSSTTSPHGPAEARSGPLDRFMWRVRLPVGPRNAQLASLSCTHAMQVRCGQCPIGGTHNTSSTAMFSRNVLTHAGVYSHPRLLDFPRHDAPEWMERALPKLVWGVPRPRAFSRTSGPA